MWVKLTRESGQPLWVNIAHAIGMEQTETILDRSVTILTFPFHGVDGHPYMCERVIETPEAILKLAQGYFGNDLDLRVWHGERLSQSRMCWLPR